MSLNRPWSSDPAGRATVHAGRWPGLALLLLAVGVAPVRAAGIGDLVEINWVEQAARFFTFQDATVRYALLGSILLGLSCGLLGSFLVVRKMALVGDALSHAVLPGVALGFLWNLSGLA